MEFSIVVAFVKKTRGIGWKNTLPWKIPEDMKYFKALTTSFHPYGENAVIMGRRTWESIADKYKPLPKRKNIVVTSTLNYIDNNVTIARTFEQALSLCPSTNIFVIGGEKLFKEAIYHPLCRNLYVTEIDKDYECDTFFPQIPLYFKLQKTEEIETFLKDKISFKTYTNVSDCNSDETKYLTLLKDILFRGEEKIDRTGIGTISLFGSQLRFFIGDDIIPLLTTKKVFWKGIVEELLFFLRGDHDNRKLQAKGVHIWDGNTSQDYFNKNNLKLQEHDLGLAYGVQWRAAGAQYENIDTDYRGKGIDQISEVISLLKTNPHSRRIIINAWNVPYLKDMSLVPCHVMYQFYVSHGKYLNCMMTQRSADMFLGLPFNIASVALLTKILANVANLKCGEIIINLGDTHIYKNHIEQVKIQLERIPLVFPKVKITKKLENIEDIEQLCFEDFELINYHSWPTIKADMAI